MGILKSFFTIPLLVLAAGILLQYYWDFENNKQLIAVAKWADENKIIVNENTPLENFKIEYNQNEWDLLTRKLEMTRYFETLDNVQTFEFGFPVEYAKELVEYWKNDFNWKKQIESLNKYQNYKIKFDDITLHFVRVTSKGNKNRIPILLLNGWPSTFYELYPAIDYIIKEHNNQQRHFDIVVPSIPGYAYSTPLKRIFGPIDVAKTYDALMRYLYGENCQYFVHGEDWGAIISSLLSVLYPTRVRGVHVSMVSPTSSFTKSSIFTALITHLFPQFMLTQEEKEANFTYSLTKRFGDILRKSGYFHIQATTPDTIGYGFSDSPVGLMTYILEKYAHGGFGKSIVGTKDGKLSELSRDDLLTIVTLYWMTNSMTSSMRLYKAAMYQLVDDWPINSISKYRTPENVPFALTAFPNEIDHTPYAVVKKIFGNLKQYTIMKSGGHFAAFQDTKVTCDDFIRFVNSVLSNSKA